MATADDALNVARSRLGSGPDEFVRWYGSGATTSTPWCAIFQSWVLTSVGLSTHYAWVSGLFDAYRSEGRTFAPTDAQAGDLVAFDYDGGGSRAYDHIAIVEVVEFDATGRPMALVCVDGNWANRVQRVRRWFDRPGYQGGIAEIARPTYTSNPQPSPEGDEVKQLIVWDSNGTAWHCCGNTRVGLTSLDQYNILKFLGVQELQGPNDLLLQTLAIVPRNGGTHTPGN